MTFSIKDFFSKRDQIRRKLRILVTFTKEILNRKLHFLCIATFLYLELNPAELPLSQVVAPAKSDVTSTSDLRRVRRGFRSYFYNYLDEIAMSICASIPSEGPGLLYAVRRTCGEKATCKDICTDPKLRKQGKSLAILYTAGIYIFKVNNGNTRTRCMLKICSKLTITTQERRQWRRSGVFIVNFEHLWHFVLVFLLLTLSRKTPARYHSST